VLIAAPTNNVLEDARPLNAYKIIDPDDKNVNDPGKPNKEMDPFPRIQEESMNTTDPSELSEPFEDKDEKPENIKILEASKDTNEEENRCSRTEVPFKEVYDPAHARNVPPPCVTSELPIAVNAFRILTTETADD
jgi:hypothetical protein